MYKKLLILFLFFACTNLAQAQWTTDEVSLARSGMGTTATTNGKVVFAGGYPENAIEDKDLYRKRVDIYDIASDTWTIEELEVARQFTFAVSVGTKVYFAGYTQTQADDQDKVEVYDTETETWTTLTTPNSDGPTSVAVEMGSIYFVDGGIVDIYDTTTETWSMGQLSVSRILSRAVGCNGKVFFAGGGFSAGTIYALVDIYDIATDTWSTADLSEGRNLIQTACLNEKAYFVGGSLGFSGNSSNIDVYDTNTDTWSVLSINGDKQGYAVGASDNNLYIAAGYDNEENEYITEVEIFDGETDEKTTTDLSEARAFLSAVGVGNQLYVGGGNTGSNEHFTLVDIYTEEILNTAEVSATSFTIFPNPTTDRLVVKSLAAENFKSFDYRIYNAVGMLVKSGQTIQEIEVADFERGIYFLEVVGEVSERLKFIKN